MSALPPITPSVDLLSAYRNLPLRLLTRYGFVCFDVRNGDGGVNAAPWSLTRDHPLALDQYRASLIKNDALGKLKNEKWRMRGASFDDLACVNVARVGNTTVPPMTGFRRR
jgi:hypothetical protein